MAPVWALGLLDHLLMLVHLLVIGINVFGWMWARTRRLHRWTLLLTTLSWLGLGAFYGWGYCFLTDLHWSVKRELGERVLPHSFIQYVLHNKLGFNFPDAWVNNAAALVFLLLVLITAGQMLHGLWKRFRRIHGSEASGPGRVSD
ncbi:DUF2784 family protein [Oligoflexus tunisiensis]|uniref:DUF2784 family protein n=1 Tax=Oligoflexus tunisiensis TaxID=708132 RepID=UPI00114D3784|nr:DUF2784 family protein [Oligoflexus tunisiensis]